MWHTGQPAFVKISEIGSFPVTNGTMSGTSAATGETGVNVSEEGGSRERRARRVPRSNTTTMRGVIDRSGIEPISPMA